MTIPDLNVLAIRAELEAIRGELICRDYYGKMIGRLEGRMEELAQFLGLPILADCDPSLVVIEAILVRVLDQAAASWTGPATVGGVLREPEVHA